MIKYPLYKSPTPGKTPFDKYKEAASGDTILDAIESQMQGCYQQYEYAVSNQNVHSLSPSGFVSPEKDHLKKLYKSSCDIAKKVRTHHDNFTSTSRRIYHNKCPYCVLSEPNTLEHILPREDYPEYAVHVYNLIPCCSKCNSHKGQAVREPATGNPFTLNFYYHNPDEFEFLKVKCSLDTKGKPIFTYFLSFPDTADPILQAIITNHFTRLHLLDRYNKEAISQYCALESMIKICCSGKNLPKALNVISDYLKALSDDYGINHYLIALYRCLLTSPQYHSYLRSLCEA